MKTCPFQLSSVSSVSFLLIQFYAMKQTVETRELLPAQKEGEPGSEIIARIWSGVDVYFQVANIIQGVH